MSAIATEPPLDRSDDFLGQPKGVYVCFFTEMWERFSFYGMKALLLLYLLQHHKFGDKGGLDVLGAYGGLVYLSSVLGGWIADRLLGSEKTLLSAAIVVMIGHLALAFLPGIPGLAAGLVCVALGGGSLKTTTSTTLGDLYAPLDNRRDAAFSIYYMGVNIGALIGPLGTSALWGWKGFHWGFGLAAVRTAAAPFLRLQARQNHSRTKSFCHPD